MSIYKTSITMETGTAIRQLASSDITSLADESQDVDISSVAEPIGDYTALPTHKQGVFRREATVYEQNHDFRKVRNLTSKAVELASSMCEFSAEEACYDRAIVGNELIATLKLLWILRKARSRQWQKGLNFVQSALVDFAFEKLSSESCKHLLNAIKLLESSELENEDILEIKRELKLASLDPWNAISSHE